MTSSSSIAVITPRTYLPPVARSATRPADPTTSSPPQKSWTYLTSMAHRLVPKRWNFGAATSQYWRDNLPHKTQQKKEAERLAEAKILAIGSELARERIVPNSVLRRKCSQLLSCY